VDRVEISEPFTITSATDTQTGQEVEVTTSEDKDYQTANATRLESQIDQLIQERKRLEEERNALNSDSSNNTNNAGGGIPWLPDGQQVPVFLVAFALAAVVVLNFVNKSRP